MQKCSFFLIGLILSISLSAQPLADSSATHQPWQSIYRGAAPKINDLVHTKLDVRFDYAKSYLYGKAWITLTPHFYPTDSLALDAKGMDIHEVALSKGNTTLPLQYRYDGMILRIHLNKTYKSSEHYTVYIDYISKPDELIEKGSNAIRDAKGLYFINPTGAEKDKPTQIWTQGETESNSAWFPTIDHPNQKSTEEILMTVPDKYVTLSNGLLISQTKHPDGSRTDYWKMDLPHAPYLFFMGVGDYAIIKDAYEGKEVAYYVEKPYASVARRIFGLTPEMIAFFSRITGVDYPWPKYDQITGRDYVSGAMENTTATLHGDRIQQDARTLADGNSLESNISHELFHQWFGDLVTTESWSNITLNESFADFGEMLWLEYKYGKDRGDEHNYAAMRQYLTSPDAPSQNLVRYYYQNREDLFDRVSYSKGGRILNMLRNYLGDSAFFKGLNLYLVTNKFKTAEATDLRLAFEQVSGQDLHWYWNQWYFGSGHPKLNIDYKYNDSAKQVTVTVRQTQETGKIFRLPVAIDVYAAGQKQRHRVWLENLTDSFQFSYSQHPDLVNVDGDKILLCEKQDNKSLDNFIYQYRAAGLYVDRLEAIDFCLKMQSDPKAQALLKTALKDPSDALRRHTLEGIDQKNDAIRQAMEPLIAELAKNDPMALVRAKAIELLGSYKNPGYKSLFMQAAKDSSYTVSGRALEAWSILDSAGALGEAKILVAEPNKGVLSATITSLLLRSGDERNFDLIYQQFSQMGRTRDSYRLLTAYGVYLTTLKNQDAFKKGIDQIIQYRNSLSATGRFLSPKGINENVLSNIIDSKKAAGLKEEANYVEARMNEPRK
jgi:aminopeptidase N